VAKRSASAATSSFTTRRAASRSTSR
jgi:hypothetical protein